MRRELRTILSSALVLALMFTGFTPAARASEVSDIQDQLNSVSSNLNSMLYQLNRQRELLTEFDGYIAELAPCVRDFPDNQSCKDRMADLQYQRNTVITNAITEANGYISRDNARLGELRAQLAAAQKREADAAAAALAAPENKLSETEIQKSVDKAKEISTSLDQSIQQDTYFSTTTAERLAETEKTLSTLDQNSQAYKNLLEARAAYEVTLKTVNSRLQDNASLKKQQLETISALQDIQENTKAINIKDSKVAIAAAAEFQKALSMQVDEIDLSITEINTKITDIAYLLKRLASNSPEYASLLLIKADLEKSLNLVESSKVDAEAQVKATQAAADKAEAVQEKAIAQEELRVETLPQRVEHVFVGQELVEGEKVPVPVFKAKKLNGKYSQLKTKLIEKSEPVPEAVGTDEPQVDMTSVEKQELEGVKISLISGKTVLKAVSVKVNDDGTVSMKIPNKVKSGNYKLKIDLPDTDDDPELKIKVVR